VLRETENEAHAPHYSGEFRLSGPLTDSSR
jgi:hypothetical protein